MFLLHSFAFLFGLVVGSFLNALIYRLEKGDSVLRGRSYCPHCKHTLSWQDLIPVVSFLLLRGKCRYCKKRISMQYPIVEISTGLIFLLMFKFQISSLNQVVSIEILNLFYFWTVASLLIVLFVYDLKHYILPDKILFPAIGLVLFWDLLARGSLGEGGGFVVSGFSAASFFLAIFLFSRGRAMGFGDVKLAFFMGLFLGWPNILVALFCAFMAGAAVGIVLIVMKKKGMKSEVPFGPFLIAGTFVALFFGKLLVDRYIGFLLT